MPGPMKQPKLRASILYLGSALFLATGAVTIADQQIPNNTVPYNPCGCTVTGNELPAGCTGNTCAFGVHCSKLSCVEGVLNRKFITCSCSPI